MSLRKLPEIKAFERPAGLAWDAPSDALARWAAAPSAAESGDDATISLYDMIGEDPWTGAGWTAKRVAGILRAVGKRDVTVNINSPGGDFFEGLAIFNLLRDHPAKVSVKVMGLAASAASVVAMAGDDIRMGAGSFFMIHNAWAVAIGNRHDMRAVAAVLEPFDAAMTDIYAARSGAAAQDIVKMMDAESWIAANDAVAKGFADGVSDMPAPSTQAAVRPEIAAKRRLDAILAQQGMPRAERRALLRDLAGTHDAAGSATHDAGAALAASLRSLHQTIRS